MKVATGAIVLAPIVVAIRWVFARKFPAAKLFSENFKTYLENCLRCFYLCSRLGKRAFKIKFCLRPSKKQKLKF